MTTSLRAHAPGFQQQIPLEVEQASAHRGGGFPQVVLSNHGHTPSQVEMITPGDRHWRLPSTLQFGEGARQMPPMPNKDRATNPPPEKRVGEGWLFPLHP